LNNHYSLDLTNLNAVSPGKNVPREINVVVEIAKGSSIKYEINAESGIIYVDRKLSSSMIYPGNYGFVPQTKTDDGDPVDVLILDSEPLIPSCVIGVRPIGVLLTEDQDGSDSKIIAVPAKDEEFSGVQDIKDITESARKQIEHFFKHHKELEKGKFIKIMGWGEKETAMGIITEAADKYSAEMKQRK
jgi:inorganic pyrophosphatase